MTFGSSAEPFNNRQPFDAASVQRQLLIETLDVVLDGARRVGAERKAMTVAQIRHVSLHDDRLDADRRSLVTERQRSHPSGAARNSEAIRTLPVRIPGDCGPGGAGGGVTR